MTKTRKMFSVFWFALMVSITMLIYISISFNRVSAVVIEDSYDYGTEFSVPELIVDIAGKSVVAESVLYYPDGRASVLKKAVLDVSGKYVLEYLAKDNGRIVKTIREDFYVYDKLYLLSDANSCAYFETDTEKLYHPDLGAGIKVSLYSGEWITFNQPIDIKIARRIILSLSYMSHPVKRAVMILKDLS